MSTSELYHPGSLYIAGFTQARAPHLGLLLARDDTTGTLWHIRIDRATSPNWQFQRRIQPVTKDMFLSFLLLLSDKDTLESKNGDWESVGAAIDAAARAVPPPPNDTFGECGPWVLDVVQVLHDRGIVHVRNREDLASEVDTVATESKAYARRDRFPKVVASEFCQ
ncbi:hypothetical protein CYLTODRAFT_445648 [Cylindrobasidium torrendii FP15055 ss-10]|uniref:Uncharacterized protein n=1 Tax=Cylindrobasidium torrendii FP15055 ss-10 TaxID=1314674 RepID=A0A0D7B631_9AGAR|nr:hypothetical protein CYLTODRAFT_445648 [Cylindrobasidium torrendii FP15055 ss-10]